MYLKHQIVNRIDVVWLVAKIYEQAWYFIIKNIPRIIASRKELRILRKCLKIGNLNKYKIRIFSFYYFNNIYKKNQSFNDFDS